MAGEPPCGRESRVRERGGRKHGLCYVSDECAYHVALFERGFIARRGTIESANNDRAGRPKRDGIYYRKIRTGARAAPVRKGLRFSTSRNRLLYCPSRELRIHEGVRQAPPSNGYCDCCQLRFTAKDLILRTQGKPGA